jgi:hypothetical protein
MALGIVDVPSLQKALESLSIKQIFWFRVRGGVTAAVKELKYLYVYLVADSLNAMFNTLPTLLLLQDHVNNSANV